MNLLPDTLIVWTEPDGLDYALSFQDPDGCLEVWNFILEVQRYLNTTGKIVSVSRHHLLMVTQQNKPLPLRSPNLPRLPSVSCVLVTSLHLH